MGNKFLYASVKEVCHLWSQPRFDTFHKLIMVEALWSQPVFRVGKQVLVAWTEVMNVRRVANSSKSKCSIGAWVWAAVCRHTLSWRNTTLDVSIPCLLFWLALHSFFFFLMFCSTLPTLLWSLVAWLSPSALLSCPVPENSYHQLFGRQHLFKLWLVR
jgi:hypothetical protein